MIDAAAFKGIIALYDKHGWKLRRVLLSAPLRERLAGQIPPGIDVRDSDLDAAWFSRSSRPESTAWEIRHLSENPFALLEVIQNGADEKEAESALNAAEAKMLNITAKRPRAN
jgi:hypothetical protein